MIPARSSLLLLLALPVALAAQPCAQPDLKAPTQQVKAVQSQLLAFKLESDMDEDVPSELQDQIGALKDAFAALANAAVECSPASVDPKSLETTLAKLLDANQPEVQEVYDPKKPPRLDLIYGADLRVKVTRPQSEPQLLLVEFNFGICCGFDSVLLAYEQSGGAWDQVLRWQSPAYDNIGDAFGDFFDYEVLPKAGSKNWLIAVAHGHPWCTSNMSAFDVDLLQPPANQAPQQTLSHRKLDYRRDTDPVMKAEPGGFELRMTGDSIDINTIMRPVIYRFHLEGSQLVRVQPIANNGRDFVDEWLESQWDDASRWSAAAGLAELKQVHEKIAALHDAIPPADSPLFTFGPVRGCSDAKAHYQVELDEDWVDDKGNSRPGSPTFFQIEEGQNSFTMLSAAANADPHCAGPDIMAKH
ncbi:MAG: hypothetical protein ABSF23_13350 [Terracidiphilus sp.]|jgi:hypothetical protein